jgi:signal transduction histidine kinase
MQTANLGVIMFHNLRVNVLGMNIVYNIVREIMGGRIDIASGTGAGTHITVVLPMVAPQSPATTDEGQPHPHFEN